MDDGSVLAGSVVQQIASVTARDQQTLLEHCDRVVAERGLDPRVPQPPYLKVVVKCGRVREWVFRDWVPERSVECGCDELGYRHFFILYTGYGSRPNRWWEFWRE